MRKEQTSHKNEHNTLKCFPLEPVFTRDKGGLPNFMDEPTAGLDPKQRIAVRNLISEIAFQKIVLIATHVVTDVEFISKEIVLLKDGQVIKKAERETLTANLEGKVYEIKVPVSELKRIQQTYLVGNIVKEREWIYVRIVSDTLPQEKNVTIVRPSLEDVYLYYFRE